PGAPAPSQVAQDVVSPGARRSDSGSPERCASPAWCRTRLEPGGYEMAPCKIHALLHEDVPPVSRRFGDQAQRQIHSRSRWQTSGPVRQSTAVREQAEL